MKKIPLYRSRLLCVLVSLEFAFCSYESSHAAVNCAPPSPGLVSWWRGESNALDSADGNNGTLSGNTTFGLGKVGHAFTFDGNGDRVVIGNPVNLQLQNLTIEGWIKRSSASVISHGSDGGGFFLSYGDGGYVFYLGGNARLYFGKLGTVALPSAGMITDTDFHHVAVTKSGSTVTFYIDGAVNSTVNFGETFTFTTPVAIGAQGDNGDNSFLGLIDELAVYNRPLSAGEIHDIYHASTQGKCALNHAPAAKIVVAPLTPFPGVTDQVVIAAVCGGATVVLNGSQSNDSDGDALQYVWTDGTNVLSNSVTFTNAFALGSHSITLIVSDGIDTGVATTTFEVVAPSEAVALIMELAIDAHTGKNEKPLLVTLQAAANALERCDKTPALNQLRAFQNKVRAMIGASTVQGEKLIAVTQAVIDALDGP